jgi:hypothetical protein
MFEFIFSFKYLVVFGLFVIICEMFGINYKLKQIRDELSDELGSIKILLEDIKGALED